MSLCPSLRSVLSCSVPVWDLVAPGTNVYVAAPFPPAPKLWLWPSSLSIVIVVYEYSVWSCDIKHSMSTAKDNIDLSLMLCKCALLCRNGRRCWLLCPPRGQDIYSSFGKLCSDHSVQVLQKFNTMPMQLPKSEFLACRFRNAAPCKVPPVANGPLCPCAAASVIVVTCCEYCRLLRRSYFRETRVPNAANMVCIP